jgi:hypothetical protein
MAKTPSKMVVRRDLSFKIKFIYLYCVKISFIIFGLLNFNSLFIFVIAFGYLKFH